MKLFAILMLATLSLRAESFQVLGPNEALASGDIVSIVALSGGTEPRWLAGHRSNDEYGKPVLAPGDSGPNSPTRWKVLESLPGIYSFQCLGFADGPMWMNGYTMDGRVALSLSPQGVSGANWGCYREGAGWNLKCLGSVPGYRWLVTYPPAGVGMALEPDTTPSLWQFYVWKKDVAVR